MLFLSPFNFLSGNLRQAVANPLRQGAVIKFSRAFPQRSFFVVVSQWVILPRVFGHCGIDDNETSLVLTLEVQRKYLGRPRMAFIAGCQQSEIPGSPDFTRPSICDCLERVFLLARRQTHDAF